MGSVKKQKPTSETAWRALFKGGLIGLCKYAYKKWRTKPPQEPNEI